jgi:predicted DCC family thiol-disulfide oxidoreductase YuxK
MKDSVIIFDVDCLLCNRFVQIVSVIDKKDSIYFTRLSGKTANYILSNNKSLVDVDSIIFYLNGNIYIKSDAVIRISKSLGFPYNMMSIFKIFPRSMRDIFYDFVARNRYKFFGKANKCLISKNIIE